MEKMLQVLMPTMYNEDVIEFVQNLPSLDEEADFDFDHSMFQDYDFNRACTCPVNQVGGALPSAAREVGRKCLVARALNVQPYPGFGATSADWSFTLPEGTDTIKGFDNIIQALHELVEDILEQVLFESSPSDFVRFAMMQDGLDRYISLPFMPRDEVTVERVMREAKRVLGSYRQISLTDSLRIHLVVVSVPQGKGKKRTTRTFNLRKLLASKKSYVAVKISK